MTAARKLAAILAADAPGQFPSHGEHESKMGMRRSRSSRLQAKAARLGRTPQEVLREVLSCAGEPAPWRNSVATPSRNLSKAEEIAAMEAISVRSAARPMADLAIP